MGYTRKQFPKTRRLRKTRLTPRNKALMNWFREVVEYEHRIKHTIIRVGPKAREGVSPVNKKIGRSTRRYFQLEVTGLWQSDTTQEIKGPFTGFSVAVKKQDFNYSRMIDEADGYVKHYYLHGSGWTLFKVISMKIREFARVFK